MTLDTCGPLSETPFAFYDPESSSLRTSQGTFPWDSTPCSPTLPRWGSMRNGALFEHPTPELAIDESGCSSLLPTPAAADGEGGRKATNLEWRGGTAYRPSGAKASVSLREALLLPTPVANDDNKSPAEHLRKKVESGAGEVITSLTVMARQAADAGAWSNRLLPTPTVGDSKSARNSTAIRHRTPPTGVHAGDTLTDAVSKMLPTPTSRDHKGRNRRNQRDDATCLPGAVTRLPSPDGSDDTDQHPNPSTRRAG